MRTRFLFVSCAGLIAWMSGPIARARADELLTRERSVAIALEQNAEVLELAAERAASEARLSGASLLLQANPEAELRLGPRFGAERGRELDLEAELTQSIEIFGQRGARISVADAEVQVAEARVKARRADLAAEVRTAYARALGAEALLEVEQDALALARELERAADHRLRAGEGSQIEVNAARVEVGRALREISSATQGRASAASELRLLLALEPATDLRFGERLETARTSSPARDRASLIDLAKRTRQDLLAVRALVNAAQAAELFAERDWLPRPRFGAAYQREEGAQAILGILAVDVPTFNQNQGERGAARARRSQALVALAAKERVVAENVILALSRRDAAEKAAAAYGSGVVQALEQNLKLVTTAFQAGKLDLFEVLVIRRDTLDARRGLVEALEERAIADAELLRALGQESELGP